MSSTSSAAVKGRAFCKHARKLAPATVAQLKAGRHTKQRVLVPGFNQRCHGRLVDYYDYGIFMMDDYLLGFRAHVLQYVLSVPHLYSCRNSTANSKQGYIDTTSRDTNINLFPIMQFQEDAKKIC